MQQATEWECAETTGALHGRYLHFWRRTQPTANFMKDPSKRDKEKIEELIEDYYVTKKPPGKDKGQIFPPKTKNDKYGWRIDMQGSFQRAGRTWLNLQIQKNNNNNRVKRGAPTTVSQVFVQMGLGFGDDEMMRRAFRMSLNYTNFICMSVVAEKKEEGCPLQEEKN